MASFSKGITNISYLAIGNILASVVHMGTFILIARELSVEDYGVWTGIGAYLSIFAFFTFEGLGKVVVRDGSREINQMSDIINKTIGIKNLF